MLFATAISAYYRNYVGSYNIVFNYLGDLIGYSVITNLVFIFLYFRKSFCIQTKIAVIGLMFMNVGSLFFLHNDIIYNGVFDLWITLIVVVLVIVTILK